MSKQKDAVALSIQTGLPVIIWGPPGTGKTSFMYSLAATLEKPIEVVIASIREPSDFGGMPVVNGDKSSYTLAPARWAVNLIEKKDGILFIDETSTCPPAVQAALLRVVQEGAVGDVMLPENVWRVGAANPPEQAAGGWHLAPPLANRMVHFDWDMNPVEWAEAAISGFESVSVPILPANWKDHIPQARSVISSFIKARPHLLFNLPENENDSGKAWASPRSWDMAAHLLAAGMSVNADREMKVFMVQGAVGNSSAFEFINWLEELDLPDPEELLSKKVKFDFKTDRNDQVFAVLSSVVSAFVNKDRTPKRWLSAWDILADAAKAGKADVAAFAAKSLAKYLGEELPLPNEQSKAFIGILKKANIF